MKLLFVNPFIQTSSMVKYMTFKNLTPKEKIMY